MKIEKKSYNETFLLGKWLFMIFVKGNLLILNIILMFFATDLLLGYMHNVPAY